MRALVLAFLLAGCGLQAVEPEPAPRVDASAYVCPNPGERLVTLETANGDTLGACVPMDDASYRGWKHRSEGNTDPDTLP